MADKRVLAVGPGGREVAKSVLGVEAADWCASKPGKNQRGYDQILLFHSLPKVGWRELPAHLKSWAALLNEGGELHILVPSLEWAALQVLSPSPSPLLWMHLFGYDEPHLSGLTLMHLRSLLVEAGFAVRFARTGTYSPARTSEGEELQAENHYVMAVLR